jgi:hypothetical protein
MHGIVRPLKMLLFSPIIFLLALYMSVTYGLLYLLFTTITQVFTSTYEWEPELTGLAFIGLGIGFMAGLIVVAKISDKTVVRMTKANNGVFEPEMRLPACIFFACWVPVTFFWYGWTADKHVHVSHTVPAPTTDVVSDPVLTKVKVDCSLHWPYPFRLWHDGNLHPHSNLYH